jgi:hypothetical protein
LFTGKKLESVSDPRDNLCGKSVPNLLSRELVGEVGFVSYLRIKVTQAIDLKDPCGRIGGL